MPLHVWMDEATTPDQIREAARLGLRVVPVLPVFEGNSQLASTEALSNRVNQFLQPDAVLFWSLGAGGHTQDKQPAVAHAALNAMGGAPLLLGGVLWSPIGCSPRSACWSFTGPHRTPATGRFPGRHR